METNKKIIITKQDGTKEEVEIIVAFQFNDNKKEYMVYTKNETDVSGNITVYVSEIIDENGNKVLAGVQNDDEWARIKDVLRQLAKEGNQQ